MSVAQWSFRRKPQILKAKPNRRDWLQWRPLAQWAPWLIGSLCAAGVIHIGAIFAIPHLAKQDAWARLSQISDQNQMYVLGSAEADQDQPPLPLMSPDLGYAFCRFTLKQNNLAVLAEFSEPAWTVSVYTKLGENFYVISGADAKRKELRLLITPRQRLAEEASTEQNDEGDEQIIVISPGEEGVVMVRAPIRGPSYRQRTLEALQKVTCEPKPTPEAELLAAAKEEEAAAAAAPAGKAREPGRKAGR
jgi:uncharacterized membrane protein